MKRAKAVSLLLSLSLMMSLVMPGTFTMSTYAAGEDQGSGLELDKTATKNDDGTYTIKLEAYATGEKTITTGGEKATDIVLVLDQSGSMTENMSNYSFKRYSNKTNRSYYDLRHNGNGNGNLYHLLDDGSYVAVSVDYNEYRYEQCPIEWTNADYATKEDNLYVKTDNGYNQVQCIYMFGDYYYKFSISDYVNGGSATTSPGDFEGRGPLYYRDERVDSYEYYYTDQDGNRNVIGNSAGQNTSPDFPLYEKYQVSSTTRLAALKTAVTSFVDSVKNKAVSGNADHRIAVVGFATGDKSENLKKYLLYNNTEVFIGAEQYNYAGNIKAGATSKEKAESHYKDALQKMKETTGYNNVIASKNALSANGATYPAFGLEMAKGIFDANHLTETEKAERKRIVILFTDGVPGWRSYKDKVAEDAVTAAGYLKRDGVKVYSVGIFEGADATAAGIADNASNKKANQFMQDVSSNNGQPQKKSYYLSAADANTLNTIFEKIADQVDGGADTTLNEQAVIKDIIAPSFEFSGSGASDITLWTESYSGENQWTKDTDPTDAEASIDHDQVKVTNFDFSENWCGKITTNGSAEYRGKKLVISFNVKPKNGFLGGNDVPTNKEAGIYQNADAKDPLRKFRVPTVNVGIDSIDVTTPDKNVYLLGTVSAGELRSGTATVGGTTLKLNETNYGLDPWQYAYVNIAVEIASGNEKVEGDLTNLTDDRDYTVTVKVTPKSDGTKSKGNPVSMEGNSGSASGRINVFKPELTFMDGEAYYGETVAENFNANKVGDGIWKHNGTESTSVNMIGEIPTLDIAYAPDGSKLAGNKYTKQDVPVKATVSMKVNGVDGDITEHTKFEHQACPGGTDCSWNSTTGTGDPAFLIHIKTCQLTITKTGGADGEPYVFTVYKDDGATKTKYSEVTIVGNGSQDIVKLPVGTYTIEEDTGWSWRYTPSYNPEGVTLSSTATSGELTCSNTSREGKDKWLNGFSDVVTNIFGKSHTQKGGEN